MVAFEIVMGVVCATSAVVAAVMFVRATRLYDKIGELGTLGMSHGDERATATREIVRDEVREMVDAISALREQKGEPPLPPELLRATDPDLLRATDPDLLRATDPDLLRATDPDLLRAADPRRRSWPSAQDRARGRP